MLLAFAACLIGLIALVWSADRFVESASALALKLGMSPMTVGLTLVAFGTSAPEIVVSVFAAISGSPGLAIGNVIGSNSANIGLVLAITLLVAPIAASAATRRYELPACLMVTLLAGLLLLDGRLGHVDGLILLATLALLIILLWRFPGRHELLPTDTPAPTLQRPMLWFIAALLVLLSSARLLVWGAVQLATGLGISEAIIGLTLVAIGTSLPELATAVAAARRGHADLALGNILGSNILNLLIVLPVPALLAAGPIDSELLARDYPAMLMLSLALMLAVLFAGARPIRRLVGVLLLGLYLGYMALLASQTLVGG